MSTISLCMIVKNETKYIDNCLKSIYDIVDEIIIVDTGSTDNTKEICRKYTDKIYDFKWINDFSAARNFSFSKANSEYIMWLDADDVLLESDRVKLKELKKDLNKSFSKGIKAVAMVYDYIFDSQGNITFSLKRNRIVKNDKKISSKYWVGFVHEIIDIPINFALKTDIHVTHRREESNGTRNLDLFEAKLKSGEKFNARNTLYYAKELYYNNKYDKALKKFDEFLAFKDIWVEDILDILVKKSEIYRIKGETELQRKSLYKTFEYAIRAEALYPLGVTFLLENKYEQALFFFEAILNMKFPKNCDGFIKNDEWTIKPTVQASCCCYYLGDFDKAKKYHIKAKELSPNDVYVKNNEKYFL